MLSTKEKTAAALTLILGFTLVAADSQAAESSRAASSKQKASSRSSALIAANKTAAPTASGAKTEKNAPSEATGAEPTSPQMSGDEKVNVDKIKEKYWARGEDSELGVVQDRIYTKAGKLGFSLFAGNIASDPFLTTYNTGVSAGYHFSEYFSLHAQGWKAFSNGSSALETLERSKGATANTNMPRGFAGAEARGSPIYGKLSLLGQSIIYYDLHATGGMGLTFTESGNYVTPSVGLGQQIYLTRTIGLLVDYRFMVYREALIEKQIPMLKGQVVGHRNNVSNVVTVGVSFLLGGSS